MARYQLGSKGGLINSWGFKLVMSWTKTLPIGFVETNKALWVEYCFDEKPTINPYFPTFHLNGFY
jgi:hypothetical protein